MLLLVVAVVFMQVPGEQPTQAPAEALRSALMRVAKEPDLDEAASILSPLLSDESTLRSAYLKSEILDERTVYIVYGGKWGQRADFDTEKRVARDKVLTDLVSSRPMLIRSFIRAGRYESYFYARQIHGSHGSFPYFSLDKYADYVLEFRIEKLRDEATHPAKALTSHFGEKTVIRSAEQAEVNLLYSWQMLCGTCGRLDLLDEANTKNWRGRFSELDEWFSENRPYLLWDNRQSCIRIDEEAKRLRRPTPRSKRAIPELKPPWLPPELPEDPPNKLK